VVWVYTQIVSIREAQNVWKVSMDGGTTVQLTDKRLAAAIRFHPTER
jgi:hypothetical protein